MSSLTNYSRPYIADDNSVWAIVEHEDAAPDYLELCRMLFMSGQLGYFEPWLGQAIIDTLENESTRWAIGEDLHTCAVPSSMSSNGEESFYTCPLPLNIAKRDIR